MDITFTVAQKEDVTELAELVNLCYRGKNTEAWTTEADIIEGPRTTPAQLKKDMENMTIIKGLADNGKIVGCVYYQKVAGEIFSGMLSVDPSLQGKGIGKKLMQEVETFARKEGCSVIKIDVITVQLPLIDWYKRQGFQATGKLTIFPPPEAGVGKALTQLEFEELVKRLD